MWERRRAAPREEPSIVRRFRRESSKAIGGWHRSSPFPAWRTLATMSSPGSWTVPFVSSTTLLTGPYRAGRGATNRQHSPHHIGHPGRPRAVWPGSIADTPIEGLRDPSPRSLVVHRLVDETGVLEG